MYKDLINGIVTIALAVFTYVGAGAFSKGGASISENPAVYPRLLAIVVFFLGLLLFVRAFLEYRKTRGEASKSSWSGDGTKRVAGLFGILVGFTLGIYVLGFIISSLLFTFFAPLLLGTKVKTAILVSVPVTAVLYVVFFIFFKVPVLNGMLFG